MEHGLGTGDRIRGPGAGAMHEDRRLSACVRSILRQATSGIQRKLMSTRILQPAEWARPKGYANGVSTRGRLIFMSGQVGWNGQGEFTSDVLSEQVGQTLRNIVSILKEDHAEARHLVRLTWFIRSRAAYYQ